MNMLSDFRDKVLWNKSSSDVEEVRQGAHQFIVEDGMLVYHTAMSVNRAIIPLQAVSTVTIVPTGAIETRLRIIGHGVVLLEVDENFEWAREAQKFILAELDKMSQPMSQC